MQSWVKWALAAAVIAAAGALAASRLLPFETPDPAQAGPKYKKT